MTRLYDLYGRILTEKQQKAFELHELLDWSLSEVAKDLGVSRQGAHDLLQRARDRLDELDGTLGLLGRIESLEDRLDELAEVVENYRGNLPGRFLKEAAALLPEVEEREGSTDV
jgi:predicted DNA-binding protein YlxM (UPF0122 family)